MSKPEVAVNAATLLRRLRSPFTKKEDGTKILEIRDTKTTSTGEAAEAGRKVIVVVVRMLL